MMDLSKQQRWVVLILVGALIAGAVLLIAFPRRPQEQVITLDNGGKTADSNPGSDSNQESLPKVFVHVCGAVKKPGVYQLAVDQRVFQALDAAGGALPGADMSAVNLAARINDGDQIYLPKIGETPRRRSGTRPSRRSTRTESTRVVQQTPKWPLDLNQANAAQLDAVPGIGPSMAARIIAYRDQNGPFVTLDDLGKVSGIGDKKLEQFRAYLCVP